MNGLRRLHEARTATGLVADWCGIRSTATLARVSDTPPNPPPPVASGSRRAPWAVAALVFAILGLLGSVVVVGALAAVVGLILGGVHLRRRQGARFLAWTAVWLSVMALISSAGMALVWRAFLRNGAQFVPEPGFAGGGRPPATQATWAHVIGQPVPGFEVTALTGAKIRMAELRGRPVVLVFGATWCAECLREVPEWVRLQEEFGPRGVTILGVSDEDRAVLKPFVLAHGIQYPVVSLANQALPDPFRAVETLPMSFVIDPQGVIRQATPGPQDFAGLRRLLTEWGTTPARPTAPIPAP